MTTDVELTTDAKLLEKARQLYEEYEKFRTGVVPEEVTVKEWVAKRNRIWLELGQVLGVRGGVQGALL